MGFRTGSYAKVWQVEPVSDTLTKLRISISRKNKQSGEYVTEFSGYISIYGSAAAKKASLLKEGASIKLGDVDVTSGKSEKTGEWYNTFKCFSFEADDKPTVSSSDKDDPQPEVDSGELDDSRLPF